MQQASQNVGYAAGALGGNVQAQIKGTAVDSVNANIEALTNRANTLAQFARRISDGLLGVEPEQAGVGGQPRAVTQSTQEHIKDLEAAFERLSAQVNRLG